MSRLCATKRLCLHWLPVVDRKSPRWLLSPSSKWPPCEAPPLKDRTVRLVHSPEYAQEMAEARRLGGLRRRREATLHGAYDYEGLTSVEAIRRLLEIATLHTLGLENSVARARTLIAAAQAAAKLLETGELEERLRILEAAVLKCRTEEPSLFDRPATVDDDDWSTDPRAHDPTTAWNVSRGH